LYSPRRPDYAPLTPSIIVDRATPTSASSFDEEIQDLDPMARGGIKSPIRGSSGSKLETVQESSLPSTPAIGMMHQLNNKQTEKDRPSTIEENPLEKTVPAPLKTPAESGSESGGNRSIRARSDAKDIRKPSTTQPTSRPPNMSSKRSMTQLNSAKAKIATEGSAKNMTVETETVSSVPQIAVGGGAERNVPGRTETTGSLRLKPSTETIKLKKDKRKTARKSTSINSGTGGSSRYFHHYHLYSRAASPETTSSDHATSPDFHVNATNFPLSPGFRRVGLSRPHAQSVSLDCSGLSSNSTIRKSSTVLTAFRGRVASSKADIFEAKVASAVDEANSSDSEETFVYESNPPEPLSARPNYYHSRTPSATSMASQVNQHDPRFRTDGHHSITGKKSMKFTNNPHHSLHGGQAENGYNGTVGSGRASGGNGSHLHYIGRHGRGPTGHASLFDNEGPFSKPPRTSVSNGNRLSPRPTTPRSANLLRSPAKTSAPLLYDLEGEGADDERTPLILSLRSGRNRNSRRPANRMDSYNQPNGFCRRLTGCLVIGTALALFIALVIVGLILCSKPLVDVKIKDIENVLPTDQELMFDLHVHAINPNLVAIQITELGIDVYAKSQYVPASSFFRHRHDYWDFEVAEDQDEEEMGSDGTDIGTEDYRLGGGKDEGNDPIDDPDSKQWTLLGRIFEFDAPLIFDPSPLRRKIQSSVGEVRLARPGNHTEGISNWWEKVIQHPFDLKVRGPFLYSLPISSKLQKVAVTATTTVSPDVPDAPADDDPDTGNLHISSFVRRRRIAFAG
jgi:hypothetical protein